MRKGLGCGLIATSALGLSSHVEAQTAIQKPAGTVVQNRQLQVADPTDWNTVAAKAHDAAAAAVQTWQQQAKLQGKVNAATLLTTPGQLTGPNLASLMKASMTGPTVSAATAE